MSGSEFDLEELSGIGREKANDLRSRGFDTIESVARASVDELTAVPGISQRLAEGMKAELSDRAPDERGDSVGAGRSSKDESAIDASGNFSHLKIDNRHLLDLATRRDMLR